MIKILGIVLLLCSAAWGQASRFDSIAPVLTANNLLTVPNNATATVYVYPGAGITCAGGGCTSATTYTDSTAVTSCGAALPLTRPTSIVCTGSLDAGVNFGFWALPGKYQYCIAGSGITTQCFNVTIAPDASVLVSFGAGLSASFVKSQTSNPAAGGVIRLASGDTACWRNAANLADVCVSKNGSDQLVLPSLASASAVFFQSLTANAAAAGQHRLASVDTINWRNNANGADLSLGKDSSDRLTYNSQIINDGTHAGAATIVSGTSTLGNSSIAATTCNSAVTTAATGAATTDVVAWAYATAPSGSTDGKLILNVYPTSGNVNFVLCNPTAGALVPTGLVVNWRVAR